VTEWACSVCCDVQVSLGDEVPPSDLLCHGCRKELDRPPLSSLLAAAHVPPKFRLHVTREAWTEHFHRPAWTIGDWPGEADHWLFLWGPTGTGKTSAATVLLAEHLKRGGRGLWMDGMSIIKELGREMDGGTERTLLDRLIKSPFLVLDEPFSGYLTDFVASRMLLVIRRRDQDGLRTIVTSQLDPQSLVYRASDPKTYPTGSLAAAASRAMSGLVIEVDGPDERFARAQKGEA
jgi:hypothetical protein